MSYGILKITLFIILNTKIEKKTDLLEKLILLILFFENKKKSYCKT